MIEIHGSTIIITNLDAADFEMNRLINPNIQACY